MRPVLFSLLGVDVQAYGVSKVVAALVAAHLLARAFAARGLQRDDAYALVLWATVWGFVGGKAYFLLEHADTLTWHHLGGAGFTWYGGLVAGIVTFVVIIRRRHLPAGFVLDSATIPLTLAYGIGRVGCWLAGDGTYGTPTTLPWGVALPDGIVATDVRVHPTPLYEAAAAVLIAGVLWWRARRARRPLDAVGTYLLLSGVARFTVEYLRINEPVVWGLTQPQLWALGCVAAGVVLLLRARVGRGATSSHVTPARSSGAERVHS